MNLRSISWLLVGGYLLVVGLWHPALAPVSLAAAGLGAVIAAIPGYVLALAAVAAWLKYRPAPVAPAGA
ncbi:hypothetical protein ACF1AL_14785 [Streptomyces sp. NPDC014801]|uniref:hypothetical protein n=1 Tax=Streptomyces sp. NPDC014801 TaxID=3364916 RepID=UPI0036FDAD25